MTVHVDKISIKLYIKKEKDQPITFPYVLGTIKILDLILKT